MRRRFLLSMAAAASLAGCGFKLRQAPDFAFDSIQVAGDVNSPLRKELERTLANSGKVNVVPSTAPATGARVIFELVQELREKVVVGLNSTGQVREFQLRERVRFRLRTPQGKILIPETELLQQRDISFNESGVLAKEAEQTLLYRDMQSDIVQQLMRRLAAIKTL